MGFWDYALLLDPSKPFVAGRATGNPLLLTHYEDEIVFQDPLTELAELYDRERRRVGGRYVTGKQRHYVPIFGGTKRLLKYGTARPETCCGTAVQTRSCRTKVGRCGCVPPAGCKKTPEYWGARSADAGGSSFSSSAATGAISGRNGASARLYRRPWRAICGIAGDPDERECEVPYGPARFFPVCRLSIRRCVGLDSHAEPDAWCGPRMSWTVAGPLMSGLTRVKITYDDGASAVCAVGRPHG